MTTAIDTAESAREVARLAVHKIIDIVGTGWHPDESFESYLKQDGSRAFNDDACWGLNHLRDFAWDVLDEDIYEVGMNHPLFVELRMTGEPTTMQHNGHTVEVWKNSIGVFCSRYKTGDWTVGYGKSLTDSLKNLDEQSL